jgi:uncharacterized membrane protein YhaH (DUF805 family)
MDKFLKSVADELPFLVFLVFGAGLIVFWQWAAVQRRRMAHAERLAALEKGVPLPPESETNGSSHRQPLTREAYMLRGLIWSAIGLGLVIAGATAAYFTAPYSDRQDALTIACLGFIPFALGLAYLLYARLIRRD